MESTIRVDYDLVKNEPFLQFNINGCEKKNSDLKDRLLKDFFQRACNGSIELSYTDGDNSSPQIRIV